MSSSETTPSVKIISPHKGQQVQVESNIIVSVISSSAPAADKTFTDCAVLVLLDDIKPYQKAAATGHGGTNDYSTWKYTITPKYAALNQGENKITSKVSCIGNFTNFTKFYSVNITGIGATHSVNGEPKMALMFHLLVETVSEEVSEDPLKEAEPVAVEMEEMEALLMEVMAELAERVAMEVMQTAGMLEMGDEEEMIVLIVLQHILFGFI